ncbi:MAG: toxic anion resistance protein [Clostridia bacterium]|nr:toxic anion resistance protein [Clostridia bacterium]
MDELNNGSAVQHTPELTLTPFDGNSGAAGAAATDAVNIPSVDSAAQEPDYESMLTEVEKKKVEEFSSSIDITNSSLVMQYGAAAQQKVAEFSDSALENVRNKDFGEVGNMLSGLVVELKGITGEDAKGLKGLFKRTRKNVETMKAKYQKAEKSVDSIVASLEGHQVTLLKDISVLDKLYGVNLEYLKELTMYIIAGERKLKEERETTLVELTEKAKESKLPEDAQKASDFEAMCDRFEKKLHDLKLTRTVSIQMAPQIRLVQNNDALMTEKIQSTIVNTIPLWKSHMLISLGLAHSQQAMEAEHAVNEMTNELLKKNAENLHQATVGIAKESERGIVDIETLIHTNKELIATLEEVQKIQEEGRAGRKAAEAELVKIEDELRENLLKIKGQASANEAK